MQIRVALHFRSIGGTTVWNSAEETWSPRGRLPPNISFASKRRIPYSSTTRAYYVWTGLWGKLSHAHETEAICMSLRIKLTEKSFAGSTLRARTLAANKLRRARPKVGNNTRRACPENSWWMYYATPT